MRNIQFGSIYHMPWLEYRHALPDGRVCLRLQTGRGDFTRVTARVTSTIIFLKKRTSLKCPWPTMMNGTTGMSACFSPPTEG